MEWSVYGKILSITKSSPAVGEVERINYTYDASGNRISKRVESRQRPDQLSWYVRDAQGNVMAVYTRSGNNAQSPLILSETHLYGSSRLGLVQRSLDMGQPVSTTEAIPLLGSGKGDNFTRGQKIFELTNHLGNVLAVVSDRKTGVDGNADGLIDHYVPDITSAQDYYAFGMQQPQRTYSPSFYRFGFNSQEKSDEISGLGNHNTAIYGEYDTRLARRWNLDPRPDVGASSYSVFSNSPIWKSDILLDTPTVKQAALMAENSYAKFNPDNPVQARLKEMGWNRIEKVKINMEGLSNLEITLDDLGTVSGFNMALYSRTLNGKTEWVLANAGTADLIDVGSDAKNLTGNSDQYAFSVRFARAFRNGMGDQEVTYVGHSLGGGLAAANSLATGNAAITFNPAGVSWGTRIANNLPRDRRNGQIQSFVVGGEAVDRSQRLVGSKANGQISYIHPEYGRIDSMTAMYLRWSTDVLTSIKYHMMSVVIQSLEKADIQ